MAIRKSTMAVAVSQAMVCWGLVALAVPGAARADDPATPAASTQATTVAQAKPDSSTSPSGSPAATTGATPAATPPAGTGTAATPASADTALENIVVTAQNRREQVQQVPITMSVVTTDQIDKLEGVNLGSLNGYIPGLTVDAHEPTQPTYTIRGIQNLDFGIGTDAPVGVYVDGVYTGKTGGALLNFNDVDRIEILQGPQGTLFGRNSAAGAIAVVTRDPTHDFSSDVTLRLGNYDTQYLDGVLNVPLSDHVAARFSIVTNQSAGWLKDQYSGQEYENANDWGTRLQFLFDGLPDTRVVVGWEHERLNQQPTPAIGIVTPPSFTPGVPNPNIYPNINPSLYVNPITAPLNNDVIDGQESRTFDGLNLRVEHNYGDALLTSTTAYRHFNSLNLNDRDGTDQNFTYFATANVESNSTFQQEFKLSESTKLADWSAGVSYYLEHATQASVLDTNTSTLNSLYNNSAGEPLFTVLDTQVLPLLGINASTLGLPWQETMNNTGDYNATALYGDVKWHLTDQWSLTTGGRLTHDEKSFSWYEPNRSAPQLDQILSTPGLLPALQGLGIPTTLLTNSVLLSTTGDVAAPFKTSQSWTDFSPRAVLQYDFAQGKMAYFSVTRGYQAGGFNSVDVNSVYQPETVVNYELGTKLYFSPVHLLLDASLFDYKFDHLQSLNLVPAANGSLVPTYQVVSSDESAKGLDLTARWKPTTNMQLFFVSEYIDQTYNNDTAADGTVLTGQPVGTPLWTGAVGGDYYFHNVLGGTVDLTLQGTYTGAQRCNSDATESGTCLKTPAFNFGEATHKFDFKLGWVSNEHTWGVALYCTNLTNTRYVQGLDLISATKLGTPAAQITEPRFFGIELSMHL